jgi:CRISPR-associated protein Cst2
LNNEGAEGNHLQTRQVQVVDERGQLHAVNAISGDMLKHIQAKHLYNIALEQDLPLCNACARFDANRIVADEEFASSFAEGTPDVEVLSSAIKTCTLDDLEGILITSEVGGKKRAIGRKSVVEFGWVVGRPESTRTESYFHVKYDPQARGKGSGDETGANIGQNIFHRPASSGQYAVVLNVDLYRVGFNDIEMAPVLTLEEQQRRVRALLQSVLYTFVKPEGALRNTQNPHIVDFTGSIATSNSSMPAPTVSPLNSDFQKEIVVVAESLNKLGGGNIEINEFQGLGQFARIMAGFINQVEAVGGK